MSDSLKPPGQSEANQPDVNDLKDKENIRLLSRSPHPYHKRKCELLEPSGLLPTGANPTAPVLPPLDANEPLSPLPTFTKESTPGSDSGTEADDEAYVKRLPAPRAKLHKGLRGRSDFSESATPIPTPTDAEFDQKGLALKVRTRIKAEEERRKAKVKRNRELKRRTTEVVILGALTWLVVRNPDVEPFVASWEKELRAQAVLLTALVSIYPLRVAAWAYTRGQPLKNIIPVALPSSFDPAPALYPQLLPILVALLTAANVPNVVLPNLVLGIASVPRLLIPTFRAQELIHPVHWTLTCTPLLLAGGRLSNLASLQLGHKPGTITAVDLPLLYPLHQNICVILHQLTKESLLPSELQLLSISLVNLLILSSSPQAVILQALLWIGGLGILILCGPVIRWSINLAKVRRSNLARERWRASRNNISGRSWFLSAIDDVFLHALGLFSSRGLDRDFGSEKGDSAVESDLSTDDGGTNTTHTAHQSPSHALDGQEKSEGLSRRGTIGATQAEEPRVNFDRLEETGLDLRRRTWPFPDPAKQPKTHTPSGRPKRSISISVRCYTGLTPAEVEARKWEYAAWVYASIVVVIFGGIESYVWQFALDGQEPVGWALGYLFGNIHWFRMLVRTTPFLDQWISLPDIAHEDNKNCHLGWVQQQRLDWYGEANTRLLLAGWWVAVIIVGLALVFRLSPYYEVDTRRKIFHFMMVTMFLPTIFVDPTWCALALSIVLAIFLLLDLLRASQLPPLSKPIAAFLQPYTDSRDHQGPVVISHIFLLIGCAIPFWLSLASLPRTGSGMLSGWEVPTRELSMIAGVVCVGLGDAAASLCGRRWGKHMWYWRDKKSYEGSAAFAAAVSAGLLVGTILLKLGGWPVTSGYHYQHQVVGTSQGWEGIMTALRETQWGTVLLDTGKCATLASMTEAVLTGANDNVVVPVVLWTCVKSLGL